MSNKVNEFTLVSIKPNQFSVVLESIEEGLEDDTVLINKVDKTYNIKPKPSPKIVISFDGDKSLVKCISRIVTESIDKV